MESLHKRHVFWRSAKTVIIKGFLIDLLPQQCNFIVRIMEYKSIWNITVSARGPCPYLCLHSDNDLYSQKLDRNLAGDTSARFVVPKQRRAQPLANTLTSAEVHWWIQGRALHFQTHLAETDPALDRQRIRQCLPSIVQLSKVTSGEELKWEFK